LEKLTGFSDERSIQLAALFIVGSRGILDSLASLVNLLGILFRQIHTVIGLKRSVKCERVGYDYESIHVRTYQEVFTRSALRNSEVVIILIAKLVRGLAAFSLTTALPCLRTNKTQVKGVSPDVGRSNFPTASSIINHQALQ
jgi:hypothetical protein